MAKKRKIQRRTTTVTLYQGDDFDTERQLMAAVEEAAARAGTGKNARLGDDDAVVAAAAAYDEFVAEAAERAEQVVMQDVPRSVYRLVVGKHPPRPDSGVDAQAGFNVDEGGPLLVAKCIAPDEFESDEDRDEFLDDLNDANFSKLFNAAYDLNRLQGPDPKEPLTPRLSPTSAEKSGRPERLG